MIEEMKMYGCDCDGYGCSEFWQDPETGSIATLEAETTRVNITESEWHISHDGKTYCPDCHKIDDNDEISVNNSIEWQR